VFEKEDRIGGLLRYGIPDFKMEKHLIDRRMAQMSIEGVEFRPAFASARMSTRAPSPLNSTRSSSPAARAAARPPRAGPRARGHSFAMAFLPQQNRVVAGDPSTTRSWRPESMSS
jgi:glutamate synthase (NADPH/NADH) small chain